MRIRNTAYRLTVFHVHLFACKSYALYGTDERNGRERLPSRVRTFYFLDLQFCIFKGSSRIPKNTVITNKATMFIFNPLVPLLLLGTGSGLNCALEPSSADQASNKTNLRNFFAEKRLNITVTA
jgi:hypothetical protein